MPRRAARIDGNQQAIVESLEKAGATVEKTHGAHNGFPDLVVGVAGLTVLAEVKDGSRPPSERRLNKDQRALFKRYQGAITVLETCEQALELVNRMKRAGAQLELDWDLGAVADAR